MTEANARSLIPMWAEHINDEPGRKPEQKLPPRMAAQELGNRLMKKYGIFLIAMCLWTISLICEGAIVMHRTELRVRAEMVSYYDAQLEAYKAEQREQEQASHWLSGDASREAAINQEVDAVAAVISKLSTDQQKLTEASCMLARVMSPSYPGSFQEVAQQASQWMFYDGTDNTFSPHDRDLADSIVRPYMESGIVPNGLTAQMVYGSWSQNDFVLRDSYETTSTMHTWRHQG